MRYIALCCLALILIGTLVPIKASDNALRLGIRAGVNRNKFSIDKERGLIALEPDIDMLLGFGAGLAAKIPLTSQLSLSPEASFYYRESRLQFYFCTRIFDYYDYYVTEMVISVPFMVQFMPVKDPPLYLTAGVQLDIPFRNRFVVVNGKKSTFIPIDNRSSVDFGIPFGAGVNIARNFGFDFRYVINLNKPFHDWESSLRNFGFGVSYFIKT